MKTTNLLFYSFLILSLCSTTLNKNKLKTKQNCAAVNSNYYTFDNQWDLNNGYGEILFQGKGRDAYIRLHNQMDNSSHQYWIIIAGWDNTKTRITRGDGSTVCEIPQTLDLSRTYDYRIILNPSASRIRLLLDGNEAWTCVDKSGWNAPSAQYFSISKWCCADMSFCNIRSTTNISESIGTCFIPDPNRYTFNDNWYLPESQGGLDFKGYGNDLYIRLSNQQDSSSYQYWIVMGGWGNTTSKVYRGDGSTVCSFDQTIDLSKTANYEVYFNSWGNSIELYANGSKLWACVDSNGWNGPNAKWISISRYSDSFYEICDVWALVEQHNITADKMLMLSKTAR
jgi:hypothetical protein